MGLPASSRPGKPIIVTEITRGGSERDREREVGRERERVIFPEWSNPSGNTGRFWNQPKVAGINITRGMWFLSFYAQALLNDENDLLLIIKAEMGPLLRCDT